MKMKTCRECGVELVVGDNWAPSHARNRQYICRPCLAEAARRRYWANVEKMREADRRRYEADPKKHRESARRWYEANPEKERERARRYREANPERVRESRRRRYEANPEKMKEAVRRWREANREKHREISRRYYARKLNAAVEPVDEQAVYELSGRMCIYCGVTENLELDHVVPLSRGGVHSEDNLVVACRGCNTSKGAKPLREWLETQPRAITWVV